MTAQEISHFEKTSTAQLLVFYLRIHEDNFTQSTNVTNKITLGSPPTRKILESHIPEIEMSYEL